MPESASSVQNILSFSNALKHITTNSPHKTAFHIQNMGNKKYKKLPKCYVYNFYAHNIVSCLEHLVILEKSLYNIVPKVSSFPSADTRISESHYKN